MPRLTTPAATRVYAAAQRFIASALRADDSLFTPGTPIWSPEVIDDLYHRFVEHPDVSADSFEQKLHRQLRGDVLEPPVDAAPATYQLAGELLYIYYLPANGIGGMAKRQSITTVLKWSPTPVAIPDDLAQTLDAGIAKAAMFFMIGRPFQLTYLLRFVRRWKTLSTETRDHYLADPWAFKDFANSVPVKPAYAQRELLLHLVHPATFEPIMAHKHKQMIGEAFAPLADPSVYDLDRRLEQIRAALASVYGADFHFYDPRIFPLWYEKTAAPPDDADTITTSESGTTGVGAGLSGADQIRIALARISELDGTATMQQIADAVESRMAGSKLSAQGLTSLCFFINRVAVTMGYLAPYDKANPGWHITPNGRTLLEGSKDKDPTPAVLPHTLGVKLRPYVQLATHLNGESYTPAAICDVMGTVMPPIIALTVPPDPARLVDDLLRLRLLEPLDEGHYRRWPHLGDASIDLLLRYCALTLLVPVGEDDYRLPALEAPFDSLPHLADAWPLGEPLLAWYAEAGLVRRNADGTWQALPQALAPLDDSRTTAQAINTFLANLRRVRSGPSDLPILTDTALRALPPTVLEERIAEIQRELLIDRETILRVYRSLIAGHHVILSGPPGTGKTHLARILPRILWRDDHDTVRLTLPNDPALAPTESPFEESLRREGYLVEVVTATEDWGVRHVIGGIAPKIQRDERGSTLVYTVAHGCLTRAVLANYQISSDLPVEPVELPRREHTDAAENRYRGLWLVIDEFNRAQVDAAFGGLLTTLGGQCQPTLTFPTDDGERTVRLPRDFRLIGTLNSFDRHFLNQISEAMKRRFTFIDVLPPGRECREEEQAMALFGALSRLAEHGLAGFSADADLGYATWTNILSVRRSGSVESSTPVRYDIGKDADPAARVASDQFWRIFAAVRIYRQLGTAQAESGYRDFLAGRAVGMAWNRALDAALADTLADQLQVIARDELRVLLALIAHPEDSTALRNAIIAILSGLSVPRQSAQLLQLRLIDPSVDTVRPEALTDTQVRAIFGPPAPLGIAPDGLFARRLTAFVSEQGL